MNFNLKSSDFICVIVSLAFCGNLLLTGCQEFGTSTPVAKPKAKPVDKNVLKGSGSSFVYPLFLKMFAEYGKESATKVNYRSIGSGGGVVEILNKFTDFGGSDAPLNDDQITNARVPMLHIPIALGADVVTYNLSDLKDTLKLTPGVIAKIYLGQIKYWDDKAIKDINPGVTMPDLPIKVIHRSDGSGSTYIWTDYLSKVSDDWKKKVGKGGLLKWPVGAGEKGVDGVGSAVQQTPGAIGYIAVGYAIKNNLAYARVQNKAGKFTLPTLSAITTAADVKMPDDARVSITNTDAPEGYPISSFTWAIIYKEQSYDKRSADRAKKLLDLLWFDTHTGQQYCTALNYAPLSATALTTTENILKSATYGGQPILK